MARQHSRQSSRQQLSRQRSRRRPFRLALVLGTVVAATGLVVPAQAASVPRVSHLTNPAQHWYAGRLKMHWAPVAHATYQLRWSRSSKMTAATMTRTSTNGAWVGPLYRGSKWYFQARAVRSGHPGAWSRVRSAHFANRWPAAAKPTMSGTAGGVTVSWPYAAYATRYRVKWSPAAYDQWPGAAHYMDPTSGGWIPQTARRSSWTVPTDAATDPTMTALPYANPIFSRVETNDAFHAGSHALSPWRMAFPRVPTPASGDPVRMGSYNVMLGGTLEDSSWSSRYPVIASNILSHGLTVVALQEIFADSSSRNGAQDVADWLYGKTKHHWQVAGDGAEGRILFDSTKFVLNGSGLLNDYSSITNYRSSAALKLPWARLHAVGSSRNFVVVSAHFVPHYASDGSHQAANNIDTGNNAKQVMQAVNDLNTAGDPVIIAGDYTSNNQVYGDTHPAQPTFVRSGYYDAMAAQTKVGVAYGTVNKRVAHEAPAKSGLGGRPDAIFLKGITGTTYYRNVANYTDGRTLPPSDHNLIYADLQIAN